jgi:hypothetical protein
LKTTVTGVEMFKKILDHGEVMILKQALPLFLWFRVLYLYLLVYRLVTMLVFSFVVLSVVMSSVARLEFMTLK